MYECQKFVRSCGRIKTKKGFSLKIVPLLKPASGFLFFLLCVCMVRACLRQIVIQL